MSEATSLRTGRGAVGPRPESRVKTEHPRTREELSAVLAEARRKGFIVLPCGEGTRLLPAASCDVDLLLSIAGLSRVVAYEPGDLTITVEGGIGIAELGRILGEKGQFLPLQAYRGRGTIGGLLATAADGAIDLGYGRVRDRIIGVKVALADGSIAKGKGSVVKNVTGYDIPRLMVGSFGTLGIIVEASFKLQPRPPREATVVFEFESERDAFDAARRVWDSQIEPVLIDVLADESGSRLAAGFDGSESRVRGALGQVADLVRPARPGGREILEGLPGASLRAALDDPSATAHEAASAVIRMTSLPSRVEELVAGARGAARDEGAAARVDARPALGLAFLTVDASSTEDATRAAARALAFARGVGHATLLAAPAGIARGLDAWGPASADSFLMRRIRDALDPGGLFARGGFPAGL